MKYWFTKSSFLPVYSSTVSNYTGHYLQAVSQRRNLAIMASSNLWQSLLRDSSVRAPIPSTQVLLLGGTEVGKSSLIQRWQGIKNPSERVQTLEVLPADFTSFHVPSEEDPSCQINVWSLNTEKISSDLSFLSLAIDAEKLANTVALVAVDGSKPWTIKPTLDKVCNHLPLGSMLDTTILTCDVNPKHLANFFNNLLSRPDKQKGARLGSFTDKAG
ncbi:hypothetical protein DYB32_009096 [Aphanomyces invadans]|uniref:Dynein light intermediate chain n=1 Tax=Aphanomyces invadans TaxID=157072 RepID=A0A3R6WFU4_9STRA|nr:hypothetical protein DYB32_009096 [Aphanomyces invadans]